MFGMFRKKEARELLADAEALFAAGDFGEAKLAFDRAEERARKDGQGELAEQAAAKASTSCDRIAEKRIKEAENLANGGHLELAEEELRHALDTARSPQVRERVAAAQRLLEQLDAQEQARPAAALSEEERLTLITGSWEALQAKELESYGEPLLQAALALEDDRAAQALPLLERLLQTAKEPSYLWLELGRARLALNDDPGAREALRTFLARIGPEEGGAARLVAHRELARIAHEAGDHEAAIAELEASAAALEDDPRPLLDLGNYLRLIKRPRDAIEVLEMCAGTFEDKAVEWPVTMELGLACADAGESERGIAALEAVLDQLGARGHTDFPPQAVTALAKLHEEAANLTRAADLYRALCQGSDNANHASYHREAARLLDALGLADEAQRMRTRAEGLTPRE
ncbi:MAG: hypothetical protein QM778_04285 [Myxococcales bacterium]